jgi:hypothetical protein
VIVSLSTIPSRAGKVHLTIEGLLRQRYRPDQLVLWVSEETVRGGLSFALRRQMRRGLEVRSVPDLGPQTKLVPALQAFPGALVVTADDDTHYPLDWLGDLVAAHARWPDCVICHRAHRILLDDRGGVRPYAEWDWLAPGMGDPSALLFPTGVGGVLYPPSVLDPEVSNARVFREICPTADDVWFKAMSLLSGARCQKVRPCSAEFRSVRGTQRRALADANGRGGMNDVQLQAVFRRYDLFRRLAG